MTRAGPVVTVGSLSASPQLSTVCRGPVGIEFYLDPSGATGQAELDGVLGCLCLTADNEDDEVPASRCVRASFPFRRSREARRNR